MHNNNLYNVEGGEGDTEGGVPYITSIVTIPVQLQSIPHTKIQYHSTATYNIIYSYSY